MTPTAETPSGEGWRYWITASTDPPLRSPWLSSSDPQRAAWPDREHVARCVRANHRAPHPLCHCGVRVLESPSEVVKYLLAYRAAVLALGGAADQSMSIKASTDAVIGRVSASGLRLIPQFNRHDDDAVRVERVRIEELHVPRGHRDAGRLARYYKVPVVESRHRGEDFWRELGPYADPAQLGCVMCLALESQRPAVRAHHPVCGRCQTRAPGIFGQAARAKW